MSIGQISFFRMSSAAEQPYGSSASIRSTRDSRSRPHRRRTPISTGPREGRCGTLNESVEGGTHDHQRRVPHRAGPGRVVPLRAGTLFEPVPYLLWKAWAGDEPDEDLGYQALNCLLIETPAGRVLVETGIGERADEKRRRRCDASKGRRSAQRCGTRASIRPRSTWWR